MPKNMFVPTKCLLQTLFVCAIHGLHYASTETVGTRIPTIANHHNHE